MLKQKIMTVIPSWMERSLDRRTRAWGQELMGAGRNEHSARKQFGKKWAVERDILACVNVNCILLHFAWTQSCWSVIGKLKWPRGNLQYTCLRAQIFYLQFRYKLNCPWPSAFEWWTFLSKLILDFLSMANTIENRRLHVSPTQLDFYHPTWYVFSRSTLNFVLW